MTAKYHQVAPVEKIAECTQAGTINSMQQLLEQLSEFQIEERKERRDSEKRIVDALEKIADQGARIISLENADLSCKNEVNLLYGLHRELEKKVETGDPRLDTIHTFYLLTTNKYMLTFYTICLFLLLINTVNNLIDPNSIVAKAIGNILN